MIITETLSFVIDSNVIFYTKPNFVIECHMREKESRRYINGYSYVGGEMGYVDLCPERLNPIKSINIYREYKRKHSNA